MFEVAILNDYSLAEFQGGCNLTLQLMTKKALELGFDVTEYTPKDFEDSTVLKNMHRFDIIILNNINMFPLEAMEEIIRTFPYVKYEHDYSFCQYRSAQCELRCKLGKCTPAKFFWDLYSKSKLNIFFSPLQLNIYKQFFKETMRDAIVIPAPFEKDKWYPDKELQKDMYLFAGILASHKGIHQVLDFADSQKDKIFHFAGKAIDEKVMERIKAKHTYLGEVLHQDMPALLRKYKHFIINPQMPETFGLTVLEAICSGCSIVKFQKSWQTGLESYKISPFELIDKCIKAPETFWKKVKEVIYAIRQEKARKSE